MEGAVVSRHTVGSVCGRVSIESTCARCARHFDPMRSIILTGLKSRRRSPACSIDNLIGLASAVGANRGAIKSRTGSSQTVTIGAPVFSNRFDAAVVNAESSGRSAGQGDGGKLLVGTMHGGTLTSSLDETLAAATTNTSPLTVRTHEIQEVLESDNGTTDEPGVNRNVGASFVPPGQRDEEAYSGYGDQEGISTQTPLSLSEAARGEESGDEHIEFVDSFDGSEGITEIREFEQWVEESGRSARKSKRKKYVWPELRTTEGEEPEYEYLEVDPSDLPERRRSSQKASGSGRSMKYTAPKPKKRGQKSAPSVKREPSGAARACLSLLSEYKDPGNLPYEEFRETVRQWASEQAPRRADGMDVLRALLEYQETQVFIRVSGRGRMEFRGRT